MSSLAAAAFAAGILGGVHCAGMCGGIAASLSAASRGPVIPRQFAFNAGRIGSYAAAGAAAGALGNLVTVMGPLFAVQTTLFVLANLLMILLGLYVAGWGGGVVRLEAVGGTLWRRIEPLRRHFFPIDSTARAVGAGAVWGWVPCGLVYGMLALAMASGNAVSGALVLLAFGIGTLPSMLAAGLAAQRVLAWRRHAGVRRAAGLILIGMALFGLYRTPGLAGLVEAGWACIA